MAFDDPQLTMTGNITDTPDLRFTPSGAAVCTFTVAYTPRTKDAAGAWIDDKDHTLFMRCTAWRHLAEHIVESLDKGHRVTVRGTLRGTHWETDQGDKRYGVELQATDVAVSLQYATAAPKRAARTGGSAPADPWTGEEATLRDRPEPAATS
jgi:single-strand DNA-binding protein